MSDRSKSYKRHPLNPLSASREGDVDRVLTDAEFQRLKVFFASRKKLTEPELRFALELVFGQSFHKAKRERLPVDGKSSKPIKKPITRVRDNLVELEKSALNIESVLRNIEDETKTYCNEVWRRNGKENGSGKSLRFRVAEQQLRSALDVFYSVTRTASELTSTGPSNISLSDMAAELALLWEVAFGTLPVTDRGRGNMPEDTFLELCQGMADVIDARLKALGGRVLSKTLTGIASDALKEIKLYREKLSQNST